MTTTRKPKASIDSTTKLLGYKLVLLPVIIFLIE